MNFKDFKQPTISIESCANCNEVKRKTDGNLVGIKFV